MGRSRGYGFYITGDNFATQTFVVPLLIDSHGCGRSRDAVYRVSIDQFEDLSQNIEANSENGE